MASWWSRLFRRGEPAASPDSERAAPGLTGGEIDGGIMRSANGRGPPPRGTVELIKSYKQAPWLRAVASRIGWAVAHSEWTVYVRASSSIAASSVSRLAPPWRWGADRAVRDVTLRSPVAATRAERREKLLADGLLREVIDHPALELLQHPNQMMTGATALKVTQIWLDIKGEAFWLLAFDSANVPRAAYPVPPHWVIGVPTEAAPYFTISAAGLQMRLDQRAVLWLRDVDPENPYGRGTGVAESLGDELETDEFAAKYLKSWFFNNAMPSLLVAFEGATEPQLKLAREKWEENHRGLHNAHRAHFASGKMNAQKLDTSFEQQQLVELRRMERDTVVQVFNVPPECIGIIENSNRATIDAASFMFATGVVHPRLEFLRAELAHQLMPLYPGGEYVLLEVALRVPDDPARRLNVMKSQPVAFELNEWRAEAGYEPRAELAGKYPAALPGQTPPTTDDAEKPASASDKQSRGDPPWARRRIV